MLFEKPFSVRLLVAFAILLNASCKTDLDDIKKISVSDNSVLETGKEVEMLYSSQGILKAKILANKVVKRQVEGKEFTEFMNGLKLYFYDENLTVTSKMTSNYGIYTPANEEVLVRDDVVIVNTKGEMLNTEELTWKRKEEKIYSDKFVRITTPEEIIYGTGFEAKQDFSDYVIKNITGIIQVKDEEQKTL